MDGDAMNVDSDSCDDDWEKAWDPEDIRGNIPGKYFISDGNLISCSLSRLICIDKFTYRSIFGKVFAK